jgi:SAM-dependent methyltransferase
MLKSLLRAVYHSGLKCCPACGRRARVRFWGAMWPELGRLWELTPKQYAWFDQREGARCAHCGNSLRARQLASVIVNQLNDRLGTRHTSLTALCHDPRAAGLTIAEINSSGGLHPFLARLRGLHYSEYGSTLPDIPSEDLTALSYGDNMFDLVLTSDTLEHVPDFPRALAEIRRVLKPGGLNVFTIPIVWDRQTRKRASVTNGEVIHHLPPSYHGEPSDNAADFLVFYEFGGDVCDMVREAGFDLSIVQDARNPTLTTFVARKSTSQDDHA